MAAKKDTAIKTDAQTHDLREGDTPAVEEGIEFQPVSMEDETAGETPAEEAKSKSSAKAAASSSSVSSGKEDTSLKAKIAKAAGVKAADVTGFSAERQTIVTAQGGKYRLGADGKSVVHLAGPVPNQDAKE